MIHTMQHHLQGLKESIENVLASASYSEQYKKSISYSQSIIFTRYRDNNPVKIRSLNKELGRTYLFIEAQSEREDICQEERDGFLLVLRSLDKVLGKRTPKAPIEDLTNKRYGRLVAVRLQEMHPKKGQIWLLKCDCGNEHLVAKSNLNAGTTRSCGCLHLESAREHGKKNIVQAYTHRSEQKRPDVSINFHEMMRSWFRHNNQAYAVRECAPEILRAAIRYALKEHKLSQDDEAILRKEELDDQERWWLLLCLEEKRSTLPLYPTREEALKKKENAR